MKKDIEKMIKEKNLMELCKIKEVRKYAKDYCNDLHKNDKRLLNDAEDILKKLGIYGFWDGNDISIMIMAQKIKLLKND